MAETESVLHRSLRLYLGAKGRGSAQEICVNTEVTASEISNWLAGRRDLPLHKLASIYEWLVSTGKISITFNH